MMNIIYLRLYCVYPVNLIALYCPCDVDVFNVVLPSKNQNPEFGMTQDLQYAQSISNF